MRSRGAGMEMAGERKHAALQGPVYLRSLLFEM